MRNTLLLFSACIFINILFPAPVAAQKNTLRIGIESGPSIAILRHQTYSKYGKVLGSVSTGITAQYYFHKSFSIKTTLNYERKGAAYRRPYGVPTLYSPILIPPETIVYSKELFEYLTIPVLLGFNTGGKVQFIAEAGMFVGFLLRQKHINEPIYHIPKGTFIDTDYYRRFDTGICVGAGISVPFKEQFTFSFIVRNNVGFYDVNKEENYLWPEKTFSTNFLVGFNYKLKGNGD